MRICKKCNIPVEDNQPFCPQCGGHDFYELLEPSPSREEYNRRKKKKLIIGLLICLGVFIITLVIAAVGVLFFDAHSAYYIGNKETSTTKSEYILNDRQKSILQKEGLPTDYNSLSLAQKVSIEAIEDMFTYLDMRYPEEKFEFSGYVAQSSLENEKLIVISRYGKVTIERDISGENPEYDDDFEEIKVADIYSTIINELIAKEYNEKDYIVDTVVNYCKNNNPTRETIFKDCDAELTIFVREGAGEECFSSIDEKVSKFLREKGKIDVYLTVYMVKESEFTLDLPERYKTDIDMGIFIKQSDYSLRSQGEWKGGFLRDVIKNMFLKNIKNLIKNH